MNERIGKVKIISDGTNMGTIVIDAETGESLNFIQSIDFKAAVDKGCPEVTIKLLTPAIEYEGPAKIVEEKAKVEKTLG